MNNSGYKWYVGVTHCHTTASDGGLTLDELIANAKKNKLDFVMITDHNVNCDELPKVDGLTLIYGAELSKDGGHCNMWGVKDVIDDEDYETCETYDDFLRVKNKAKERGAVICMNHPHCKQCPWRWEKNAADIDVLEVWNAPTHYDNLECTEWWHEQLRAGFKLPVVGGSDYHRDYYGITNLLTWPVTYVYAKSNSADDILDAIVKGRTTICFEVGKTFIDIVSGDSILGDTVKITESTKVTINVKKLHKNHTLHVFNSNGECYTHTAKKTGDFSINLPVEKDGFVCAHITFEPGFVYSKIHDYAIASRIPEQKGMDLPPLIYAQSGAIYFEK